MSNTQPDPVSGDAPPLRLAELVAALSLATDMGTGQPLERSLRACLLALRLGETLGLSDAERVPVFYVALLRYVGCTADVEALVRVFGDEQAASAGLFAYEFLPAQMIAYMIRHVGEGETWPARARKLAGALGSGPGQAQEAAGAHCEVAQNVARRLGFGPEVDTPLGQLYERWDGRGVPGQVKGEQLTIAVRLVQFADDVELYYRLGGVEAATGVARRRAGGQYDPAVVDAFCAQVADLLGPLDAESTWDVVLAAEPGARPYLRDEQFDTAARAIADFTDLRSPFSRAHSPAVADLAGAAAQRAGLTDRDVATTRRAGFLHDVGRVGVSLRIWDKAGPLTSGEWERVRLYPYYTERILTRAQALAPLGAIAALHRERLDGSGYHRGVPAALLSRPARVLAAADAYQAMIEPRSYRPALRREEAAAELEREARAGRLDSAAVSAVLSAGGGQGPPARRAWPAGLSDREIEVLRLMARGLANRQMAERLSIAPKTVGHHIQHIYDKIGVSTRAAATMFALQHDLLRE